MSYRKNVRCECGRPATVQSGTYMICARCAKAERAGIGGGPNLRTSRRGYVPVGAGLPVYAWPKFGG